jgi:RHS repeat-associated protein
VTGTTTYTGYGQVHARTGQQSRLGYGGAYTDTLTGFHYNRARYYDPGTAQFLTRDIAGGTMIRVLALAVAGGLRPHAGSGPSRAAV